MTKKGALMLTLAVLRPFAEAGNIYDDYQSDEGFTDEHYQEMLETLQSLEVEASGQPLGNFGDFFQEVMSDLVDRHGWDDPYGTVTPQYDPEGRLLDIIHQHYQLGSDSGYTANEVNRAWGGEEEP